MHSSLLATWPLLSKWSWLLFDFYWAMGQKRSSRLCSAKASLSRAGRAVRAYVTAELRSSTLTAGGSHHVRWGSRTELVNQASTGQGSVRVSGSNLGKAADSAA